LDWLSNRGGSEPQSAEEIELLLLHAERNAPTLYPMITTALYIGMRKRELYGLRCSDVNLTAATLRIAYSSDSAPKSGKTRSVPIHPQLLPILRKLRKECPQTPQPCECTRRCSSHRCSEGKETAGRVIRKRKLRPL
jgi:integrase